MNKKQREAVNKAWSIIDRTVDHAMNSDARKLWSDLNKDTLEHERSHRNTGRHFTDGRAGYKESVPLTAKFFAVRAIMEPHRPKNLRDLADKAADTAGVVMYSTILRDLASLRIDIVRGAMLHAILIDEASKNNTVSQLTRTFFELESTIEEIDYSKDIAVAA
jgi:hypothetical protein